MRGVGVCKQLSSELGLHSINTWVVEHNPSLRIGERLHYHYIGRQRQCHMIDGRLYDRVLFDLLASEHRALNESQTDDDEKSPREAVCMKPG